MSVARQCELLGLSRASFYYSPVGESPQNLLYMRLLDEQYTKTPFYGVPRLTEWLCSQGHTVNRKRVARLMRKMGLAAIYPKPKTSGMGKPSKTYPYLLKGLSITRPNQVWATDITYIRLNKGFVYLVAVMDWFSRYVLSWELSNSLDVFFCRNCLVQFVRVAKSVQHWAQLLATEDSTHQYDEYKGTTVHCSYCRIGG